MNKKFKNEKRLLILLSRITFSQADMEEINEIVKEKISWCELFKYALRNKVVTLVWYNIQKLNIRHVPKYNKQILSYALAGQTKQNKVFMEEKNRILNILSENGVIAVPVKGAMLVDLLYKSYGIRTLGDLDFLIKKQDEKIVDKCMKKIGYQKGTYDAESNTVIPVDRREDIKWKIGATNFHPYIKVVESGFMNFVKIDFRHSLDESLDNKPINNIIQYYEENGKVNPTHIILHLAVHMYYEATHSMSLLYNKDINLIKFCDIREYCLESMDDLNFDEIVQLAEEYNVKNSVYYTFYYLKQIYNDGYEEKVLGQLREMNIDDVDRCYNSDKKEFYAWKKDFSDRMFASDNFDELDDIKYEMNKSF